MRRWIRVVLLLVGLSLGCLWIWVPPLAHPAANARKTFVYHRVGILAAQSNAITLILVAAWVLFEAIQRFQHPEPVIMFVSAGIGIAIYLIFGFGLSKEGDNVNTRAAALHVFGDVGASLGVIVAGILILLTGWYRLDPLLSMGIAGLIAIGVWHILRGTTDILLEATPKAINMHGPIADVQTVDAMQDVRDSHVRSITSGIYDLSAHVRRANLQLSECAPILSSLETILREKYHVRHTTFQFEYGSNQGTCREMDGLYFQMASHHDYDSAEAVVPYVKKEECV